MNINIMRIESIEEQPPQFVYVLMYAYSLGEQMIFDGVYATEQAAKMRAEHMEEVCSDVHNSFCTHVSRHRVRDDSP
jgi:hypothetical protein